MIMSPSRNRKRIICQPFEGSVWAFVKDRAEHLPGYKSLALLYRDSYYIPDGVLVESPVGILAHYAGGAIRSIDQRKARAALDAMRARVARGEKPLTVDRPGPKSDEEDDDGAEA